MVARSLSLACSHNIATRLYCGAVVTLVRNYIKDTKLFKVEKLEDVARGSNMLTHNTLAHLDMLHYVSAELFLYRFMLRRKSFVAIFLPRDDLFQKEDEWKETDAQVHSGFFVESNNHDLRT